MDKLLIDASDFNLNSKNFCIFLTNAVCANLLVRISDSRQTFQKSLNMFEDFLNDPNNYHITKNCYGTNHLNIR